MGVKVDTQHINDTMNSAVCDKTDVATKTDVAIKLKIDEQIAYIQDDAFIANPYSLLGRVIQIRKRNGICPQTLNDPDREFEFTISPIPDVKVDEASKMREPLLMDSIIVDKQLSLSVSFLSYLSAHLDASSFFSLMVFDQTTGLADVHDATWTGNVNKWKADNQGLLNDPEVCYLFAILGFVQKNVVRKKYIKFKAGTKGGAYGININGELSTSTDEYSLDIRFGLTPGLLKRPGPQLGFARETLLVPTKQELQLFGTMTGANVTGRTIGRK
jgi:hypothetical protein